MSKKQAIEVIDGMIGEIKPKHKKLQDKYHFEYKLWMDGVRNKERKRLLQEYENGGRGNVMFSLQEKMEALTQAKTELLKLEEEK